MAAFTDAAPFPVQCWLLAETVLLKRAGDTGAAEGRHRLICPMDTRIRHTLYLLLPLLLLLSLTASRGAVPPVPAAPVAAHTTVRDLAGKDYPLQYTAPTVFVFLATECPLSNRYTPRIAALAKAYRTRGIRFFAVYPNGIETPKVIRAHAAERKLAFPLIHDDGTLTQSLGATVTPEAVVLDTAGNVAYRGRVDDSDDGSRITHRYVAEALDALIAGKPIARPRTAAIGCFIATKETERAPSASSTTAVTYTRDVAPILNNRCLPCHRAGEVAPFTLDSYERAANWAKTIKTVTRSRQMPPWGADTNGEFHDEKRLTEKEIETLAAWADSGVPRGNAKDLPPAPIFPDGKTWKLGTPDAVLEMPEAYTVPAEGKDIYRCFVIPAAFAEEKWVSGVEYKPGNRSVVHHVSVFLDTTGQARKMDEADPGPGYTNPTPGNGPGYSPTAGQLGGWSPGHEPRRLPPGVAIPVPKGADVVIEVHYHLSGKVEKDRSKFGVFLTKEPVKKQLRLGDVSNVAFIIPPGDKAYKVEAFAFVPVDMTVLSVTPHMHNIGKSFRVTATLPDGTFVKLVDVTHYDFRWQPSYRFKSPVKLPKRTRIDVVAFFDNSAENPNNPSKPPKEIRWGESTDDEMCTLFLAYTADEEDRTKDTATGNESEK